MKPSVGRIVHYVSYGTPDGEYGRECRAAVITETPLAEFRQQQVSLCVLNPTGQFFNRGVRYDDGTPAGEDTSLCDCLNHDGGTWHWPARVE